MTNLITAVENALSGSLTLDGEAVPVYVRGHSGDAAPQVLIERPAVPDTITTHDRGGGQLPRLRIRVHDRKGTDGWYVMRSAEIADAVHDELSPSVDVDGSAVPFLEPQRRPVGFDGETAEGQTVTSIVLIYDLFLP